MDPSAGGDELPPSYVEATASTTSHLPTNLAFPPSPDPLHAQRTSPLPSPLTAHLRALPARLRATQLALRTAQAARDLDVVYALVPHVEAFLADLTAMPRAPPAVAELTLVPEAAVPARKGWAMTGVRERRSEGEVVRVGWVEVGHEQGGGKGEKGEKGEKKDLGGRSRREREEGFDEWGRFETEYVDGGGGGGAGDEESKEDALWFYDEEMAGRLATYLRPEPDLERKRVQAVVAERKTAAPKEEKSSGWGGRWGFGSRKKAEPATPVPVVERPPATAAVDDSIKMTVRADEVTFRRENELGVWESRTGFGIVVTVRMRGSS